MRESIAIQFRYKQSVNILQGEHSFSQSYAIPTHATTFQTNVLLITQTNGIKWENQAHFNRKKIDTIE